MLKDNISDVFRPLVVVQASKQANLSIHSNYMTPAEMFNTFNEVSLQKPVRMRVGEKERGVNEISDFKINFIDVEEIEILTEPICKKIIDHTINTTKPDIKLLENMDYDVSDQAQRQKFQQHGDYSWFKKIISSYMNSIKADLGHGSMINKPIAILSIVSAHSPDPVEELKLLNQEHMAELKRVFASSANEIDKVIFRLTQILIDKRKPLKVDLDKLYKGLKAQMQNAYIMQISINSAEGDGETLAPWNKSVYKKKRIMSYTLNEYGEKVAVTNEICDKMRGTFFSQSDINAIKDYITEDLLTKFLFKNLAEKQNIIDLDVTEKKKSIKRGIFSFMRKDEKIIRQDGKYVQTNVELAIKNYADLLFLCRFYDAAAQEYKLLYQEIIKKCVKTGSIFLELYIYNMICNFYIDTNYQGMKKQLKEIETNIASQYDFAYQLSEKSILARLSFMLVYFTEVKYNFDPKKTPTELLNNLDNLKDIFSKNDSDLDMKFLFAALEEMRARLLLYENPPQYRKFSYRTMIASFRYSEIKLEDYALAAALIGNGYYKIHAESNWPNILDFVYGPMLGKLSYGKKRWLTAIRCFIIWIKYSKLCKEDRKEGKKAVERIKSTLAKVSNFNDEEENELNAEISQTLSLISCSDFDIIITEDYYSDKHSSNAPNDLQSNPLSYSIRDVGKYHELKSIMEYFCAKDLSMNPRHLAFVDVITCKNLTEKKNMLQMITRVIRIDEAFTFRMKLVNNYKVPIEDKVLTNFRFMISYKEGDPDKTRLTAADLIPVERTSEFLDVTIYETKFLADSNTILNVNMVAKVKGALRIEAILWDEFGIERKHALYSGMNKFTTFKIYNSCGKLELKLHGFKENIQTGQIQKGSITIKNQLDKPIEKVQLFSSDPCLSGFARKTYEYIGPNAKEILNFNIVCDTIRADGLTFLAFYQCGESWRYTMYKQKLNTQRSFKMKCQVEQLMPEQKLLCLDVLYFKDPYFNKTNQDLKKIAIRSNFWKIDKKQQVIDRNNALLYYITLVRKERIYRLETKDQFLQDDDLLNSNVDDPSVPEFENKASLDNNQNRGNIETISDNLTDTLSYLNISDKIGTEDYFTHDVILDSIKADKTKKAKANVAINSKDQDLIDIFCFWEYQTQNSSNQTRKDELSTNFVEFNDDHIHGITTLTDCSIDRLYAYNQKMIQVNFNVNTSPIHHNFTKEPVLYLDIEILLTSFNIENDIQIRMLNSYEKIGEKSKVFAVPKTQKPLFFWEGKNERRIPLKKSEIVKLIFKAAFIKPGKYQINNLIVYDGDNQDESIPRANENEDVFLTIVETTDNTTDVQGIIKSTPEDDNTTIKQAYIEDLFGFVENEPTKTPIKPEDQEDLFTLDSNNPDAETKMTQNFTETTIDQETDIFENMSSTTEQQKKQIISNENTKMEEKSSLMARTSYLDLQSDSNPDKYLADSAEQMDSYRAVDDQLENDRNLALPNITIVPDNYEIFTNEVKDSFNKPNVKNCTDPIELQQVTVDTELESDRNLIAPSDIIVSDNDEIIVDEVKDCFNKSSVENHTDCVQHIQANFDTELQEGEIQSLSRSQHQECFDEKNETEEINQGYNDKQDNIQDNIYDLLETNLDSARGIGYINDIQNEVKPVSNEVKKSLFGIENDNDLQNDDNGDDDLLGGLSQKDIIVSNNQNEGSKSNNQTPHKIEEDVLDIFNDNNSEPVDKIFEESEILVKESDFDLLDNPKNTGNGTELLNNYFGEEIDPKNNSDHDEKNIGDDEDQI